VQGQPWSQGRGSHRVTTTAAAAAVVSVDVGKIADPGSNRQHNPTTAPAKAAWHPVLTVAGSGVGYCSVPRCRTAGGPIVTWSSQRQSLLGNHQARTVGVITPSTPPQTGRPSQSYKDEEYMASSYCGQLTDM